MSSKVLSVLCVYIVYSVCAKDATEKAFRVPLNDGTSIPTLGLGTFLGFNDKGQINPKENEVTQAVEWSIDAGYRLIDTATVYRDEDQIGVAIDNKIKSGAVKREDLYVVTKLPNTSHKTAKVEPALRNSLKNIGLEYVDLYLIHSPMAFTTDDKFDPIDYLETWKAMEGVQKLGLAKSIGLSNFNQSQIQRVLDNAQVKPAVLQVEVNLNLDQKELVTFCESQGILVMAYSPFGSLFATGSDQTAPPPRSDDPTLTALANKYKKTTPQIVLRYLIQRKLIPIPKSIHKNRIEQNIDVFDFKLTDDEMKTLGAYNKSFRVVWPSYWQDHPYYPYERKDVPESSPF